MLDAGATFALGSFYCHGQFGLHPDEEKAVELWTQAAKLVSSQAHHGLGIYHEGGDMKKAKFHREAAAMAGHDVAQFNLACYEHDSGNRERALMHCMIAASAGNYKAMLNLQIEFEEGYVSRNAIKTLTTYNNLCAEMRSEARDAYI